jgi:hypothetical protein
MKNRVHQYQTKIILKGASEDMNNGLVVEISATLYSTIEELYEKFVKSIAKLQDKAQMLLKTEAMGSYISTPIRPVSDLTPDHLLTAVQKSQNSGATIKFSDKLVIEFLHIRSDPEWRLPGGVGHGRQDLLYYNNHHQKRSCRRIMSMGKNTCLPACCIVGAAHEETIRSKIEGDAGKIDVTIKNIKI